MIKEGKGSLLRKVSSQPFFLEGTTITTPTGELSPSEGTLAWAIANKQKVAVEDIVALTGAAQSPVKPPKAFDAKSLKAWLEANTEIIGQAIRKQHPNDPDAAEAILHEITSAFMYHVDPDGQDVKPDKGGKIGHLEAGGPQKSQLKVDCDVLATYTLAFHDLAAKCRVLTVKSASDLGESGCLRPDETHVERHFSRERLYRMVEGADRYC